jgi:vacuolar-type H+-ATPase subunit I/STV1
MWLKYVITFFVFGLGIAIADDDVSKEKILLPDSVCKRKFEMIDKEKFDELIEKSRELQKRSEVMMEKYSKMLEESKEIQERLKGLELMEDLKKHLAYVEAGKFFDDTGLIIGRRKYFIRIWKHPPKELFNMPTKPMK